MQYIIIIIIIYENINRRIYLSEKIPVNRKIS